LHQEGMNLLQAEQMFLKDVLRYLAFRKWA